MERMTATSADKLLAIEKELNTVVVGQKDAISAVARALSRKFTDDEAYIEAEVARSGPGTCVFCLIPEHMTGKLVNDS